MAYALVTMKETDKKASLVTIEFLLFIVQITLQIINLINNIQWSFLNVKRLSNKNVIIFIAIKLAYYENKNESLQECEKKQMNNKSEKVNKQKNIF